MQIIRNQFVPKKKKKSFQDYERLALAIVALTPFSYEEGKGDCIEVGFNPEDCRRYVEQRSNYKLTIRQVSKTKWRVWKEIKQYAKE